MGENAIERGGADHWTVHPQLIEAVKAAALKDSALDTIRTTRTRDGRVPTKYFALLHDPAQRDPRGYILPSDQADFPTATKFVNTLIKNGVTVLRATRDFDLTGRHYPAQSYVVQAAQAFRPHVLDMFEPQDHPNDFQYPGGPPIPPYDNAGWTLAYQMGVSFDRILDRFDGPFEPVRDTATPPAGTVSHADGTAGFLLSHRLNDAAIATNRLLAKGEEVDWLAQPVAANGREYPAGTIFIPATPASVPLVRRLATDLGLSFDGLATRPAPALRVRPVRIGLWDRYGGSIPSGWTRWLLERFEFPFEVVYPPTLDAGKLADRYDVLVFPDGAIPQNDRDQPDDFFGPPPPPETIPDRKSTRLNSSHSQISYAVFCLKKKKLHIFFSPGEAVEGVAQQQSPLNLAKPIGPVLALRTRATQLLDDKALR